MLNRSLCYKRFLKKSRPTFKQNCVRQSYFGMWQESCELFLTEIQRIYSTSDDASQVTEKKISFLKNLVIKSS